MSTPSTVVIIGAGQAGGELAAALRSGGYTGRITLIGGESAYPYSRPPLSKAYLLGTTVFDELVIREPSMYEEHDIDVRRGVAATAIDRARKVVALDDGESVDYSTLVLATGGRARRLPIAALDSAANVFHIRTFEDVDRLRSRFVPGARLTIIGAGYIGLEVASVAQRLGLIVTVLEVESRVLARVTSPPVSEFFQRVHAEEGVDIRLQASIQDFLVDRSGEIDAIRLRDGNTVQTDIVLVGVGLVPNVELAEAAGLTVDDGVIVDEHLRTADPNIYAIGDVSRHPDPERGVLRRLESVPNASAQAHAVAEAIAGAPRPYATVPWFWSDQYDVKLQVVGLSTDYDQIVVRGELGSGRQFAAFYLEDGVVRAADIANSPRDFAVARKLVTARAIVDPARLADTSIPPRELLPAP